MNKVTGFHLVLLLALGGCDFLAYRKVDQKDFVNSSKTSPKIELDEDSAPSTRTNTEPCSMPNAHEFWQLYSSEYSKSLLLKEFYFDAKPGKMLRLVQEAKKARGELYVELRASWKQHGSLLEGEGKVLANEDTFLGHFKALELAGPYWREGLKNMEHPVLVVEHYLLNEQKGFYLISDNNVLSEVRAPHPTRNDEVVTCLKDKACSCGES